MTPEFHTAALGQLPPNPRLRVGMDSVQISAIAASWQQFGAHFTSRIFTPHEQAYALQQPGLAPQRLAARFAAKEAAMKAFDLGNVGVGWRDIEVRRADNGACHLALHGLAAQHAAQAGACDIALSLSHDGDYAVAVVVALSRDTPLSASLHTPTAGTPDTLDTFPTP